MGRNLITQISALWRIEKSLWKDPKMWLGAVAIILVPLLNCAVFTGSMWDPYGKLDRMPVGLVNLDEGVSIMGNRLNLGTSLKEKLLSSKNFSFRPFDREEKTREALHAGDLRAVLVIPQDLSKRAAEGKGGRAGQIRLIVSEGQSFFAARISEAMGNAVVAATNAIIQEKRWTAVADTGPKIQDAVSSIRSAVGQLKAGAGTLATMEDRLVEGANRLDEGLRQGSAGVRKVSAGAGDLKAGVEVLIEGISRLRDGLVQLEESAPGIVQLKPLREGASAVAEGSTKLADGSRMLADGSRVAASSAAQLSEGAETLRKGVTTSWLSPSALKDGVRALSEGSSKLSSGMAELSSNVIVASSGSKELAVGSENLKKGIETLIKGNIQIKEALALMASSVPPGEKTGVLAAGSRDLTEGIATLSTAIDALSSGATTLREGALGLATGAHSLKTGVGTLYSRIPERISIPLGDPRGMSEGVILIEEKMDALPNNGTGFAPYFISINLWLGAIFTTFFLPYRSICRNLCHTFQCARITAKLMAPLVIVTCQALTVVGGMGLVGIHYVHPWHAAIVAILSSWCFLVLLVSFILLAGDAGRLAAVILLILQAATAGGTFPIELSGRFYQVCNAVLPLSSTVMGLRFGISGSYAGQLNLCLLKLAITIGIGLLLMVLGRRKWQTVEDNTLKPLASW